MVDEEEDQHLVEVVVITDNHQDTELLVLLVKEENPHMALVEMADTVVVQVVL